MTAHPDSYAGTSPADRVRAFLDARAQDRMTDPEHVHSYGRGGVVYELRVSDLRALCGAEEYRVETRQTEEHPSGASGWFPESGGPFATREQAERYMQQRSVWYGVPESWEHRVTVRTVTPWEVPA